MKLKSIHISGFKSFADRIVIQFHDGITGVIGPNGSGKSNIIDAIRWVMGEQTAKNLRADDPTDIIFSGSQDRKQINLAEVTLTFTNDGLHCPAEYLHLPEISIGRRINRSGDREYFMNREPCRLKDIIDFLLSIGLGSKSYGIIQQDRRDRIIQASPDDLREILEETAGITVFKTRRKEAEKRMGSTSERLKNLAEIETELVRQKEALTEQVEKAGLKMSYLQELKEKEILLIKNHVGYYRGISTKVRKEVEAKNLEIEQSTVETTSFETDANDLKSEQLELTSQIKSAQNELDDNKILLTKYLERIDSYKRRSEERLKHKENLTKELSSEQENYHREEERKQISLSEVEKAESALRKLDGEMETLQQNLEEIDESLQVERVRGEEMRSELRAIETTRNTLRTKNESILESISKFNVNLQKILEQEQREMLSRGQINADKLSTLNELKQISQGLDSRAIERETLSTNLETLRIEFEGAKEIRDSVRETHLEATSHLNSLQKMIDSNLGLSDGVLVLKQHLSQKFSGLLFDSVSLNIDDEKILEKALPNLFQSALVENIDNFIDILDKAEEESFSHIGLLVKDFIVPLSTQELKFQQEICSLHGVRCVGTRLENMTWAPAQFIFNRIFICQDEWIALKARKICAELNSFIFVTERGTVFNGVNEVSFGDMQKGISQGFLQRKREYEESLKIKTACEEKLAASEGGLFLISEKKKDFEEKLSKVASSFEKEKVESLKLTSLLENYDLQIKHADENIQRLTEEKNRHSIEMGEFKDQFSKNQNNIEKLDAEFKSIERDLNDFEQEYQDKKGLRDEIVSGLQSKKSERAVVSERQSNNRRNYEELCFQLGRIEQKLDSLIRQIDDLKNQLTNNDQDYDELYREIEQIQKKVKANEEKLTYLEDKETEVSEELRVIENKLKSYKDLSTTKQKFINEKQLELARLETILETALKDAYEKFELKPQMLPFEAPQNNEEKHSLELRIKELNTLIIELGAVNERAVEEFTDVSTRLYFLLSQRQDVEKSMLELSQSIAEIEETTKVRFKEIFDKVNTEFQKIFPVLFPSGHGELHLLNDLDLLSSGVEILVRLPGKKAQNMSLFSGGEKALTAISLIFSLLKTTPAPFCFLDEVDAPLDEANVGRFNNVLEALSDDFQFVVITHNRRTMEVLDTIYGISMGEPGVSKLVSVDLSDVPAHLRKKQKIAVRAGATVSDGV
ncbi:MAG: chromosome segregation protein SMC [Bdellovibrionota bacterium]